jgi:hypothetical protein
VRYLHGKEFAFQIFDRAELRAGTVRPIARVVQPPLQNSFQGFAAHAGYLYTLDGTAYGEGSSTPGVGNATITCIDTATSQVIERQPLTDAADLTYREPEGLSVYLTDPADPDSAELCVGLASGDERARTANVYTKILSR